MVSDYTWNTMSRIEQQQLIALEASMVVLTRIEYRCELAQQTKASYPGFQLIVWEPTIATYDFIE